MENDVIYYYDNCEKVTQKLYFIFKRLFDIIISFFACICLIPISLIIKIIYVLNGDYDNLFFVHERIGKNGKKIYIYKFRTMVIDADVELNKILKNNKYKKEWESKQKLADDPRITRIGRILRNLSIDEIPQFINVLLGDMSIIGPRPLVCGELDSHDGNHQLYESIKPGITGWWACNAYLVSSYQERLELEYYYVKNCSLLLDIKCFMKTILVIFNFRGSK